MTDRMDAAGEFSAEPRTELFPKISLQEARRVKDRDLEEVVGPVGI